MEEQKKVEETLVEDTKQEVKEETKGATSKKKNVWKTVSIGGVAGILLGGTATAMMGFANANDIEDAPMPGGDVHDSETQVPNSNATVEGLPVADSVNDDMTFGEAFAAARNETGAGGVFSWRGGVYGTYLADEWEGMTPEEQAAFGSRVHYGATSTQGAKEEVAQESEDSTADLVAEVDVKETETTEETSTTDVETEVEVEADSQEETAEAEVDAEIMEEAEAVAEAEVETPAEVEAEVLETDAYIPEQQELTAVDLQQMQMQQEVTAVDNPAPDYINDADVSGFELA